MSRINKSLSSKLSLGILLMAIPVFVLSMGVLFEQSRKNIRKEATERAMSVLSTTMQRINRHLTAIETVTDIQAWRVTDQLHPDSLFNITRNTVELNPHVDGCSISMEPGFFPKYGRYFSVYSIREADTVRSVFEEQYEYFQKIWYKKPHDLNEACWVDYTDEADSLEMTLSGIISSYGKPLYDDSNHIIGIISTDISLLRLSQIINAEKPFPNSYFIMVDKEGRYLIHPDSTRLFRETIFTDVNPTDQADLIALGHEMISGKQGTMTVLGKEATYQVCYQPIPNTEWSLAIVCTDSDLLAGYHKLTYILVPLLIVGVIVILLFCRRAVGHAVHPISQLVVKTKTIAAGNYEVHIPHSKRKDVVGELQNSFATMLQSLNFHMGSVRYSAEQAERRNGELIRATRISEEADRKKTAFIQNVTHQIRTPLNIILGFSQIIRDNLNQLPEEEVKSINDTLHHNAKVLYRMVEMLFDSSASGLTEERKKQKQEDIPCNELARECIAHTRLHFPEIPITLETEVSDSLCVHTNHLYLMRSLRELLYNACKYSDGKHIVLRMKQTGTTIRFIVEDTGKGIPEADRDQIFDFFIKVDDLSEGLGLGLPLAKRHIQNLNGNLTLDTDYHDGCRFILELPLAC